MISLVHPLKRQVTNQLSLLEMFLDHIPNLLEEWECDQENHFNALAHNISEGDHEIEASVSSQMRQNLEPYSELKPLLYNSLAVANICML